MAREVKTPEGAEWKAVPCWHNCGGRCLIKALVKDGKVIRMKTDDTHEDTWERPQARSCPMGHAMHQQIFGEDRVKYPMKRKNWSPEAPNGQLRGIDEWERISWDEALDYVANELKKAKETYGNSSIFYMNMINLEGYIGQVLGAFGGYTDDTGTQSTGTFGLNTVSFGLLNNCGSDRMDLVNSEYIVMYGHNAAWCAFGNPSYYIKHAKEHGAKFVFVGPEYSATAGFTNAEWIPVRPGTDTAFLLGVAYSMVTRDVDGSLVAWDNLAKYAVGFDKDHMPEDATTDESFMDYLMGTSDGVPKTQEWASEICGTPVELIDRYADIMGCHNDVSIHSNGAPARNKGAENFPQIFTTVALMGDHWGRPGNAFCNDQYYGAFNNGGTVVNTLPMGAPAGFSTAGNPLTDMLNTDSMWDEIIEGEAINAGGGLPFQENRPAEKRKVDIHVIVSDNHNLLSSQANTNRGIEAFRKVDFVFALAYYMKLDAQYADVVLPITTRWEHDAGNVYYGFKDKENAFASMHIVEPLWEARPDRDIAEGIATRLGLDYSQINPMPDKMTWFMQLAMTNITPTVAPDAPAEETGFENDYIQMGGLGGIPVATVDEETLAKYGVQFAPQEGVISFDQFLEDGIYRQPRQEGDAYTVISYKEFRDDPVANPLATTKSGKFEIYCQAKSDWYDMINGYSDGGTGFKHFVKVSPLPKYLEAPLSYKASFTDWENKVRGPYPVQIAHVHYLRRAHTDCDNLPWLREALRNPVFINKADAEERGIKTGDTVRVFNDNGAFLRPAAVTRTVMPDVIMVPHGAGARIDKETGIDLGGADNVLTASNCSTTPYLNGWNTNLCQYEKYNGPLTLVPDCEMPQIIPIAE